jgi:ribosome biogenesis protein Tsr3
MGRIEKLKRQSIKEEVKSLVMKRFGENPPTEEDFEAFENAQVKAIDDSLDTKEYADLFDEWKNSMSNTEEEEDSEEDGWYPDQTT